MLMTMNLIMYTLISVVKKLSDEEIEEVKEIKNDPNVISNIKKANKKDNPRVIGILSFRLPPFGDPELILLKLS
ncbi:hypothetical protein SHJJP9002_001577 [Staphylococcus casei]|uniref:Uncharacterized protein n=1 Tax=Staphylococcus casei TaxID=201828 RepID=A0ABZ2WCH2_9STAP